MLHITINREHTNRSFGNKKHRQPYQITFEDGTTITKWYYSDEQACGHAIILSNEQDFDYRLTRVEPLNEY